MLAGDPGIVLRHDVLPTGADQGLIIELGRGFEVSTPVEPDIRWLLRAIDAQQERAGRAWHLAEPEISLLVDQLPGMAAPAD
ncbi:hypothetical protein D3C76_1535080 [compost metagenome]